MRKIETSKAPASVEPYSQGIIAGNIAVVSGQTPVIPETKEIPQGIEAWTVYCQAFSWQTRVCLSLFVL